MTIPFRELFKKAKARLFEQRSAPPPPPVRPPVTAKRADERLSKTVLPNMTRTLSPPDPFRMAAGSSISAKTRGREVPMAVALVAEPAAERSISLQLSDILEELPLGYIKPREGFDVERQISLKGAEIEKGMASGQPTISLATIYEQVPEIFLRCVTPDDVTQVTLPFAKVLQQFESLHVRSDQLCDPAVPQVETPFLQVTMEDNDRFGTTLPELQTSAEPPVTVQPATAASLARAEPEPVVSEKFNPKIAARGPGSVTPPSQPSPSSASDSPSSPARIPFKLPPNGTGAPASERVPASSGPPVPIPPPKPAGPSRIPFNIAPPDVRPKFTLVPGVDPNEEIATPKGAPVSKGDQKKIRLALDPVMRNVPAFQLKGRLPEIPKDAWLELPWSMIEPQLASGRVAIDSKIFQAAIPEAYRDLFVVDSTGTPVLLPLQEVLKNLPESALQMRSDQVQEEKVDYFETPFSRHADEDKQRLGEKRSGAIEKQAARAGSDVAAGQPLADKANGPQTSKAETAEPEKPEPKTEQSKAKEFVERVGALPGVAGCSITFADGLSLAGNLPEEIAADGLCAMAPSLLQRVEKHLLETKLGPLTALTLHCEKSPISFFMKGTICLAVLHSSQKLTSATREKLVEMVKELSQVYTQPENC